MSKKEEYGLNFQKIKDSEFSTLYMCTGKESVSGSLQLASLLRAIADKEPTYLLEEVNLAINNGIFEDYYSIDGSAVDNIELIPPNLIYNGYTILLTDIKLLLEEWIEFIQS